VILLDEVDGMDPNVGVALNMALANGKLVTRGGMFKRHAKTVILCAANTFGTGADAQYVGRNPLDAATLDRFVCAKVEVDYDRDLERAIAESTCGAQAEALLAWSWGVRDMTQAARLRRIVSTRVIVTSAKLLAAGFTMAEVRSAFFIGWTTDELRKVGA
jgi:cobaltochelatase CobS